MNFEITVPINASPIQEKKWIDDIQEQMGNKKEICRKIKNALSRNNQYDDDEESEAWAFGYNTEIASQYGDDDEDLQLQGCNCKYCGEYVEDYSSYYFSRRVICKCAETYISYYKRLRMEFEMAPVIISGVSKYGNYLISYTENPPEYYQNDNSIAKHIRNKKVLNAQFYDEYIWEEEGENPNRNRHFYRPLHMI